MLNTSYDDMSMLYWENNSKVCKHTLKAMIHVNTNRFKRHVGYTEKVYSVFVFFKMQDMNCVKQEDALTKSKRRICRIYRPSEEVYGAS